MWSSSLLCACRQSYRGAKDRFFTSCSFEENHWEEPALTAPILNLLSPMTLSMALDISRPGHTSP